jgi:hypothetical protein
VKEYGIACQAVLFVYADDIDEAIREAEKIASLTQDRRVSVNGAQLFIDTDAEFEVFDEEEL